MAKRLTWLATHTHSSSPSYTRAQGGGATVALEELTVHSPTQPPQRERRASSLVSAPPRIRGESAFLRWLPCSSLHIK